MRARAIACALFYGIAPFWLYEAERHYDCSYLEHLGINLGLAWRWLTFRETHEDAEFERQVNAPRRSRRGSWEIDAPWYRRAWFCLTGRQW